MQNDLQYFYLVRSTLMFETSLEASCASLRRKPIFPNSLSAAIHWFYPPPSLQLEALHEAACMGPLT